MNRLLFVMLVWTILLGFTLLASGFVYLLECGHPVTAGVLFFILVSTVGYHIGGDL